MSAPEVTITLGRSGQVVKRKRVDLEGARPESHKSSIRDRLGDGGSSIWSDSKRQRGLTVKGNLGHNSENDPRLDRNDLRYKLIHRRLSRETGSRASSAYEQRRELRGELSAAAVRSSMSSNMLRCDRQSPGERNFLKYSKKTATDLRNVDSSRNHYSTITRYDLRWRSPARPIKTPLSLSPPMYKTEMQRAPSMRSMDASGVRHVFSNSIPEPSRSTVPARMMRVTASATARPLTLFPAPSGVMPKSYMAEAPVTVGGLLNSLGLGKYAIHFQAEEVDMSVLKQMGEKDLKALGIPMGPRKKILEALSAPSTQQLPRQL